MPKEPITCDCTVIHADILDTVQRAMPPEEARLPVVAFFKTLGDKTRINILMALDVHEMCVCDLSVLLNMTKSSVSHQLKTLKDAGLVKARKEGKVVFYALDDYHVQDIIEEAFAHTAHKQDGKPCEGDHPRSYIESRY
ncbi:MAG: metalloregulator ArsR/SmtB family transcription factor [Faecalibacterium sp.]